MLVTTYVRTVYVPARIILSVQYEKKLYSVVNKFSTFLGRPAELKNLTESNICGYLAFYRKSWSARSTNNQRQVLLSIWQDVANQPQYSKLLSEIPNPRRIRKLPEEIDPPEAWDAARCIHGITPELSWEVYDQGCLSLGIKWSGTPLHLLPPAFNRCGSRLWDHWTPKMDAYIWHFCGQKNWNIMQNTNWQEID